MKKFISYNWIMFDMIDVIHMSKISNHYLLEYQTLLDSYEMQAPNVTNGFRVLDFSDDISDVDYTSEDWSLGESYSETSGEIHSLQGNPPAYSCSAGSKPLSIIIRRCNTPSLSCSSPASKAEDENVSKLVKDSCHPSQINGVNPFVTSETLVNANDETIRYSQLNDHSNVKSSLADESTSKNVADVQDIPPLNTNVTFVCESTDTVISCQTLDCESNCESKNSEVQYDNESKVSECNEQLRDTSSCSPHKKGDGLQNPLESPVCLQKSPLHSRADTKLSCSSNSDNSLIEVDNSNTQLHHAAAGNQEKSVLDNEPREEEIPFSKLENREEKEEKNQNVDNEPLNQFNNNEKTNYIHNIFENVKVANTDDEDDIFPNSKNESTVKTEVCVGDDLLFESKLNHSVSVACQESKLNKASELSEVFKCVKNDTELHYDESCKAILSKCVDDISDSKLKNGKILSPLYCETIDCAENDFKTDKIENFVSETNSKALQLNSFDKAFGDDTQNKLVMTPGVQLSNIFVKPATLLMKSSLEDLVVPKIDTEPVIIGCKEPKQLTSHVNVSMRGAQVSALDDCKAIEIATELSSKVVSIAFKEAGLTLSESLNQEVQPGGVSDLICTSGIEQKLSVVSEGSQVYNPPETVTQTLIENEIPTEFIESSLPLHTSAVCQSVHKSTEVFSSAISGEQSLSSEPINAICIPSKPSCRSTAKDIETLFPPSSFSGNGPNIPGILMTSKVASSFCSSIQLEQKLSGGGGLAPDSWEAGLSFGDIGLHAPDGSFPDVGDALNCEDLENSRLLSCSPLLFSSDDENTSVTEEVYKGIELALAPSPPPPPSSLRYANVVNEEKTRVRRLQELLTGAPPPPAVTHPAFSARDALEALRERAPWAHADPDPKPVGGVSLQGSDAWSKEAATTPWPLVKCLQYLGIHYNHGAASEQLETLCQKLASRWVGCETASSVCGAGAGAPPAPRRERRTQASAPRRPSNAPPTGLSPGRRLSHLARRRRAFSSDALLASGAPTAAPTAAAAAAPGASQPPPQLRLRPMLPHAQPERRTIMVAQTRKKTPKQRKSSGKKRSGRLDNYHSIHVAKLNSSKRALFQSPTEEDRKPASIRSKFRPSGTLGSLSSKRALFTDDAPSGLNQSSLSGPSGSGQGSARKNKRAGSAKKRQREDGDEESARLPKRRLFGDAGPSDKLAQPLPSTSKETANTKLSSTHKKKLLWAVAEALKEKGIGLAHAQFRVCAASLAARLQRGLVQQLLAQRQGSTSDKMLQLARSFVNEVVTQHGVTTS